MLPLVTIVIPVYNRVEIICETIESAIEQTYQNKEIIIIDNCSNDGTYEKINENYGDNKLVRIFRNKENVGPVNNWKNGISYAKGEYIKILFSDDLMQKSFIEKAVYLLEREKRAAFAFSSVRFFSKLPDCEVDVPWNKQYKGYKRKIGLFLLHNTVTAYKFGKTGYYENEIYFDRCFCLSPWKDIPVSPSCALFRKEALELEEKFGRKIEFPYLETGAGVDLYIFLNALICYEGFCFINEPLCYFRAHSDSITVKEKNLIIGYDAARTFFLQKNRTKVGVYQRHNDLLLGESITATGIIGKENVFKRISEFYDEERDIEYNYYLFMLKIYIRRLKRKIGSSRGVYLWRLLEINRKG